MNNRPSGFTIVELLIVVVVIAILAAIAIVSYNGISNRSKESSVKSDLNGGAKQLELSKTTAGSYPTDTTGLKKADTTTFQYVNSGESFCLSATNSTLPGKSYYISNGSSILEGTCPTLYIQSITASNCSTSRTMVADARDNRSYWIQKLGDGKCWMLTNLAYAGAGTNTYGDVKTIQNGTGDTLATYIAAKYYMIANANPTTYPTQPSSSTDGGTTGTQYGYLYNWCAAMGAQIATSACANALTPVPNTAITICPSGWRLPTGNTGSELNLLNNAVNNGSGSTDVGLKSNWLLQRTGGWWDGAYGATNITGYWSSTQSPQAHSAYALFVDGYNPLSIQTEAINFYDRKQIGYGVRCVAI